MVVGSAAMHIALRPGPCASWAFIGGAEQGGAAVAPGSLLAAERNGLLAVGSRGVIFAHFVSITT
jgi:hypothetical protein